MSSFKYSKLKGSPYYLVIDGDDGKDYGIFSLLDVPKHQTRYSKNMDFHIKPDVLEDIIDNTDFDLLVELHYFVFQSVLKITKERDIWCKMYTKDDIVSTIYNGFAKKLGADYQVNSYRNWIEIKHI